MSDAFGLQQARSVDAERAIQAAMAWMRGDAGELPPGLATRDAIDKELRRLLAGYDDFWYLWVVADSGTLKNSRRGKA